MPGPPRVSTAEAGASPALARVGHTVAVKNDRRRERHQRRTLRLRTRVTLFFSLTALAASLGLAVVTYTVARSSLLDQRTSVATQQAFVNAKAVSDELAEDPEGIGDFMLTNLRTETGGYAILLVPPSGRYSSAIQFNDEDIPSDLIATVGRGTTATQQFQNDGEPFIAVGVYIAAFDAEYFEAFPLTTTERTLSYIATALAIGAAVTTLLAAFLGLWTSRRLLRPLSRVADAAGEIASGGLDTRMPPEDDPDLARLASSFNDMADAVQARIEREARFASDVSHELRSPITALSAAIEVLDGRRDDLPDRSQQALDVVVTQVRRFDQMVMDLLELSRLDAGSTELHQEEVDIADLITRITARYGFAGVPIEIGQRVPATVLLDKLRFERVLANLLDNADKHGGGPTRVLVEPSGRGRIALAVEDAGPGVARSERARIFERFARGSAARHRVGTGLGLALVAEHAQAHGGEAWVEERPGGGARFIATFGGVS